MNVVERAKNIILTPKTEWAVIAGEPGDVGFLFTNYVAILAAIPAICEFIGWQLIGLPFGTALIIAVVRYVLSFVTVYVMALVIDQLAPTFGGRKDFESALKLATYAATPVWLSGIFLLIPRIAFLAILGLYAVYLLWTGIPPLTRAPEDRSIMYTVVVILCLIVIWIVFGVVVSAVIGFRAFM